MSRGLIEMGKPISKDDFLAKKRDYSPLLVHLTRNTEDYIEEYGKIPISAKQALDNILSEKTLRAFNYKYCLFGPSLAAQSGSLQDKFKVVCFTETPIDQIDVLLENVIERDFKLEPYGLVFEKKYVREKGGNPVFYLTKDIARVLLKSLFPSLCKNDLPGNVTPEQASRLLALVTVCEEGNDWHWEREWRIVGNLEFNPADDIYCGLCPEEDILYFESSYRGVKFISPTWGINKILDKLVKPNQ